MSEHTPGVEEMEVRGSDALIEKVVTNEWEQIDFLQIYQLAKKKLL